MERARRAGRESEWSPPSVRSLGLLHGCWVMALEEKDVLDGWGWGFGFGFGFGWMAVFREPSSRYASLICRRARVLSKGVTGMSPQSRIVKGVVYGFRAARWLKPRKEVCRDEAARMARGPNRAPFGLCQGTEIILDGNRDYKGGHFPD